MECFKLLKLTPGFNMLCLFVCRSLFVCLFVCLFVLNGRPYGTRLDPGGLDSRKSLSQAKKPIKSVLVMKFG